MTLEEAELFYKKFLGHKFHMGREDGFQYHAFEQLNLSEEYYVRWDHDLLNREYEALWTIPDKAWVHQGNILDIIYRGHCSRETEVTRLLDEMEKMDCLSLYCRTLIIENMAGRTASLKDGGVWLICTKTKQGARMQEVMPKLLKPGKFTDDRRFNEAVRRYEDALRRYGRK